MSIEKIDRNFGYAVRQRMYMIDFLLIQYGSVRRSALMRYFGISQPQASADFATYAKAFPGNLDYDKSRKMYVRSATFCSSYFSAETLKDQS